MENNGIPYFSLLCQPDNRWEQIEIEYGLKGFAILVKLHQRIFSNGYYLEWTKEIEQAFMQKACGLPKESQLVSALVKTALKRGLFSDALFQKYRILTSIDIQKQYLHAVVKRNSVQMEQAYLLIKVAQIPANVDIIREKEEQNSEQKHCADTKYSNTYSKKENIKPKYINTYGQPPANAADRQQETTPQPSYALPLADNSRYPIHQEKIDHWKQLYPSVDILQELRLMYGWLESNPTKGKDKKDINRFITNWLANSQKKAAPPSAPPSRQSRFVNYQQRTWDFEELARLERERLRQMRPENGGTTNP